jgi:hypothetical protein
MFRLISCVKLLLARLDRLAESEGTIHDKSEDKEDADYDDLCKNVE